MKKSPELLSLIILLCLISGCYTIAEYRLNDLSKAAAEGDTKTVQSLINQGININDKGNNRPYATALHWSARNVHIDAVKALLMAGADANARDLYEQTPLFYAIDGKSANSLEIVKVLIEKGADVNACDSAGMIALAKAIYLNNEAGYEIAKLLIAKGSKINELTYNRSNMTLLLLAASYGQVKIVSLLLDSGANINAVEASCQQTPLIAAITGGKRDAVETAKLLIERGSDIDAIDCADWNALDHAKAAKKDELITLLVSKSNGKWKIDDPNFQATSHQNSYSNLIADLNRDYTISVSLDEYMPKLDPAKYTHLKGKRICLSNIRNQARFTSNFSYYSKDRKVRYQLTEKIDDAVPMLVQSYFWYAYQKAFKHIGIEASDDCSKPDLPELWIIFQSLTDERLRFKITVLKNGETLYEKNMIVTMELIEFRDYQPLQKRAYEMIDRTIANVLDDKEIQAILLK